MPGNVATPFCKGCLPWCQESTLGDRMHFSWTSAPYWQCHGSERLSALMPSASSVSWNQGLLVKTGVLERKLSSLQCSSPPVSAPKVVLKVLFLCCWISSFPGREGTLRERWGAGWILTGLAWPLMVLLLCGFSPPSALLQPEELELPRFQVPPSVPHKPHCPSRDALLWCCGSHYLYLLGEPVAALLLLRNKSWQLLFTRVWLFTANFLQVSSSCSPYPRTSVMYCLYFLLDSSPGCFLFSCCQFCTLPDLVRVLSSLTLFLKLLIFIL